MTTADPSRGRVYEAETILARMIDRREDYPVVVAFGSHVVVPNDRKFGDIASVQRYVDAVLALAWVQAAFPSADRPVRVRARAGALKAEYHHVTATIAVPPHDIGGRWAMRELVVLHEIAHHLVPGGEHGADFVAALVELVETLIGHEAAFLLSSALFDVSAR